MEDSASLITRLLLTLALVFAPASCYSSENSVSGVESSTITVSSADEFLSALKNAKDGDIIDLGGSSIQIGAQSDGNDPLVNNASITIQNGDLSMRTAGIVQGSDLVLKDLTLTFQNSVRNGIFSNGYNTTIENVKRSSTAAYSIHIAMGPIFNPQSSSIPKSATTSKPNLIIKGDNSLGNIYMGVLDDIADDACETGYYTQLTPTVTVDTSCTSTFDDVQSRAIYACGVSEVSATSIMDLEKTGDGMIANADRLRVNSLSATINLGGSQVKSVYGNTGTGKHVAINYYGGEYPSSNIILDSVGEINVKSGIFCVASNTLSLRGIIEGGNTALGVESGATLVAGALGDASVYSFYGGGTLALGTSSNLEQTLTITGSVSGTTDIVFGDTIGFWKSGVENWTYIKADKSYQDSFVVSRSECVPANKVWNRDASGQWSFASAATEHVSVFGYVSTGETEHAYQCTDPNCPYEDCELQYIEDHWFDDESDNYCEACGYERVSVHDIFVAKDDTKLEQLQARVFNALLKKETSIDVSDIAIAPSEIVFDSSNGTLTGATALAGIVRQHPLFSTLCVGWGGFALSTEGSVVSTIDVEYLDLTWKTEDLKGFIKAYDECMALIDEKDSEFQKAAILHDWLCGHVTYSLGADKADFALGAIAGGRAVCAGYSYAYQFLCQQASLECMYISGTTTKEAHAWNKVKIFDQWFFVDTTWDSGLASGETFSHAYFMCNDDEFPLAGDGGHAGDTNVVGNDQINTQWYFANKFWDGKTGALTDEDLSSDPLLKRVSEDPSPDPDPTPDEDASKFELYIAVSGGGRVECDKQLYSAGDTAKLTIKGGTSGTNVIVPFALKVNGITTRSKEQLVNKSAWTTPNAVFNKKMKQNVRSVEFETVAKNLATGYVVDVANVSKDTSIGVEFEEIVPVYRLYNTITSEHLFSTNKAEYDKFVAMSKKNEDFWIGEGINWFAPKNATAVVHRLYNPGLGSQFRSSHYYTSDTSEIARLTSEYGWIDDGQEYRFKSTGDVAIWTCYNEALRSAHHYTSSKSEWQGLKAHGWDLEVSKNGKNGVFRGVLSAVS